MKLELSFDDNHELDTVINCCNKDGKFECKINIPSCVKTNLLELAMAGVVHREHFSQIRRLGKFYLENVFHYNFYEVDSENRSVVHYLAWTGKDESLADILEVIPSLANMQDEYGETPLMLAVRGGKPCLMVLKLLLNSSHVVIDTQNRRGWTALHLATSFGDQVCAELLVRSGASVLLRDRQGLSPVDTIHQGVKDSQKKILLSLMKNKKISK